MATKQKVVTEEAKEEVQVEVKVEPKKEEPKKEVSWFLKDAK
jgi:hypothetical protein